MADTATSIAFALFLELFNLDTETLLQVLGV